MEYKFNKKDVGATIGYIRQDGTIKKDKKINIAVKGESSREFDEINLETNQEFQLTPRKDRDRDIIYVAGIQNVGKSYWIKNYIQAYRKTFNKEIPIYFFSDLKTDKTLEEIEGEFKRIPIDNSLITDPITMDDFEEVYKKYGRFLVIFDDVDNISDKKLNLSLYNLIRNLIHIGRHWGADILISTHTIADKNKTKDILNSCDSIVIFPFSITRTTRYAMKEYFDVDEKQLKEFKKLNSRWLVFTRGLPRMVISQRKVLFLTD